MSPSSRRAWIEILGGGILMVATPVALLAEGVDRNDSLQREIDTLTEVALLAEGVDRNREALILLEGVIRSPSSRRAWIEIIP